jgi:putative acetyltransferase
MAWVLRGAEEEDAPSMAVVHRASMREAMPYLPELHTPDEDRSFFEREVRTSAGWVTVDGGMVRGFALVRDGWLNHLYVDVGWQGVGMGSALLDEAVAHVGTGMRLWAFQRNVRARAFYAARGFREVEVTDGSGNEEKEPDVLLRWP